MAKFKISKAEKSTETVNQVECGTVEEYISCRFGSSYNKDKVKVELVKAEAPKTEKTTK